MASSNKRRPKIPPPQARAGSTAKGSTGNSAGARNARGSAADARTRLAAEKRLQEQRRRRLMLVVIPVAVVLIAVGALVIARVVGIGRPGANTASGAASDTVISAVTSVPPSVLDKVGAGTVKSVPKAIDAPALTEGGKPVVLYVGAEYCPYCAAERWAMVVALSRFGSFTGLGQTTSSSQDAYPSTPTLTFHGSSFRSSTLVFRGVETQSNQVVNGQPAPLDTLSATDQKTFDTYNAPPYVSGSGSIPFVDIGGKYVISGASYDPQVLQGKTHEEIAKALSDPNSDIAQAVDGTANVITAAICASTNNAPSNVCNSAGVQTAVKRLS